MNTIGRYHTMLSLALNRLAMSDTPGKRANARKAFKRAMRDLQAAVAETYPTLRKDGSVVAPKVFKGYSCPYCKVPCRDIGWLVNHLVKSHNQKGCFHTGGGQYNLPWRCPCGQKWSKDTGLRKHLAGLRDMVVHLTGAVLLNVGRNGESRGSTT